MSKWKKHVYRKKVDKHQAFVHTLKVWIKHNNPDAMTVSKILEDFDNLDLSKL
jgi:hypothetical protein